MGRIMDPQETKIYIAALIAAGVLALILTYFFINIIRQQRKQRRMQKEKINAEMLALEKERSRIAADLHDELGPLLSAVRFRINSLDVVNDCDQEVIEKANLHIDESINRLREISRNLLPHTLHRKGLVSAIQEFISQIKRITDLNIVFQHETLPQLAQEKNVNLFRILQELIHNTVRHSHARNLSIHLTSRKDMIILTVKEDGIGFDINESAAKTEGLGLRNLLNRTDVMRGQLSFESEPGKGVCYVFEIPVK